MRAIIILVSIALAHGAKLENAYLPPTNARTAGGSTFLQTPLSGNFQNQRGQFGNGQVGTGFGQVGTGVGQGIGQDFAGNFKSADYNSFAQARPERPRAALDRNAAILRLDNNNDGERFQYAYETENGIYAEENGVATNGVEAQGGYSYTGDDGQVYSVRYTADQNGFVPQGDHLPTPPPVPEEILKALEQNARDEAAGIYDDGSYNERKYSGDNTYNGQYNYQNQAIPANSFTDDSVVTNAAFSRTPNTGATFGNTAYSTGNAAYSTGNAAYSTGNAAYSTGNAAYPAGNAASSRNVNKAYLPPFRGQRQGGRRQSFNERTGYNY